ncbi:small conductance calcium-activated potassium channel protein 2-like [Mizuhopecten yessoensis]|uniref:Small conductance calcium-activated potassium channel protein 2 n=1 Tax=Mizuhopecten yessoensis TaxID=6573 RepID=A0A210PE50_MIZYE|nr:small conductance calcium-activated potassium channel protein 2-like [Mizuhopecten yessoensis]OWF34770.1 Small conductance calcium-activated potassium channel protein 2 [Mizuhopecten yessoensis]
MWDEEDEEMELDSPKTPLFKFIRSKMTYSGGDVSSTKRGDIRIKNRDESKVLRLGDRINLRKEYIQRRRWIVDLEFVFAMAGIILMMIETELYITHNISKTSVISLGVKCIISVTTMALLVTICFNYYTVIQIKVLDMGVRDWRSVITAWMVFSLLLELIVCTPHPFPGDYDIVYTSPAGSQRMVSIDAVLSILMMTRLYLVGKFAVVHSRLLTDTSTSSIGTLSKVKINAKFVFRAAMTNKPGLLIFFVMVISFLVNTWAMRTCEIYYEPANKKNTYLETMWLVAITFLTVGYGDATPSSYCGRYISIITGSMGVVTTALLVAMLARNLEQSRQEKYVFNFVSRMQIENRKKSAAANAIKNVLKIWTLQKNGGQSKEIRKYTDRLKHALKEIKVAREEMDHIGDGMLGMVDVAHTVDRISTVVDRNFHGLNKLEMRINSLDMRLSNIEDKLNEIRTLVSAKLR